MPQRFFLILGTSVVYEEEKIAKEDLARLCQKAENDANFWRLKYEQDGVAKIEDLEHTKLKLQARLAECESTVDNLSTKLDNLEKSKVKLQTEIEGKCKVRMSQFIKKKFAFFDNFWPKICPF